MKGKFLLFVPALLSLAGSLAFAPIASAQTAKPAAADAANTFSRYDIFAGAAYSGANQVKGSSGLIGFNVGADAKLKKWFGGTVDFGEYQGSSGVAKPVVTTLLAGPEFYIPSDKLTGFLHVLFGGAHTGNAGEKPDIAFAYAVGGGFSYAMSNRLAVRVAGDGIYSSFVYDPTNQGFSPHLRINPRATLGVDYRF